MLTICLRGGNATNFTSAGSGNHVVAYKAPLSASGQDYFYPPLIDDQHATPTIVNGMGRTDLTIGSTTIADVQNQYNAARAANPNNVIVLHLNGTFTVGSAPLTLASNTCVLLERHNPDQFLHDGEFGDFRKQHAESRFHFRRHH